jgi:hypothetical protein
MISVHILLGGVFGFDGPVMSAGMYGLAKKIAAIPEVAVKTWTWNNWEAVLQALLAESGQKVLIGYSGGGSRATWVTYYSLAPDIDLMVAYDPSPKWQVQPLHSNVKKAICYYNLHPMMPSFYGMLGGGKLVPAAVDGCKDILTRTISEQHLLVQADQKLHAATVEAIVELGTSAAMHRPRKAEATVGLN